MSLHYNSEEKKQFFTPTHLSDTYSHYLLVDFDLKNFQYAEYIK